MKELGIVLIAALIGYVTNFLAIKMLFRPYTKKRLFGIPLPFTPGIIPKNRENIARKLSEMMAENILTEDVLAQNVLENVKMSGRLKDFLVEKNIFEIVDEKISQGFTTLSNKIALDLLNEKLSEKIVDNIIESVRPKLGFFGGMIDGLKGPIIEQIDKYIEKEAPNYINNYLVNKYESLLDTNMETIQETSLYAIIMPIIVEMIKEAMKKLDLKETMEKQINSLNIKEFEKMLISVLRKELRAITYLGAVLGALIGLLNLLFI